MRRWMITGFLALALCVSGCDLFGSDEGGGGGDGGDDGGRAAVTASETTYSIA